MKNTKNMFVSILSAIAFCSTSLSASSVPKSFQPSKKIQEPSFELFNKSTHTITITLFMNNKFIQKADIDPQQKFKSNIDINQPMQLGVYDPKAKISTGIISEQIIPRPLFFFHLTAPGKTKYITWNPAKAPYLYPQTGPWLGHKGVTESGLSLSNNIKYTEIN